MKISEGMVASAPRKDQLRLARALGLKGRPKPTAIAVACNAHHPPERCWRGHVLTMCGPCEVCWPTPPRGGQS